MQNKETLIIMMTSFINEYDLLTISTSNKNGKTTIRNVGDNEFGNTRSWCTRSRRGCTKSAVESVVGTESSPRIEPLTYGTYGRETNHCARNKTSGTFKHSLDRGNAVFGMEINARGQYFAVL